MLDTKYKSNPASYFISSYRTRVYHIQLPFNGTQSNPGTKLTKLKLVKIIFNYKKKKRMACKGILKKLCITNVT